MKLKQLKNDGVWEKKEERPHIDPLPVLNSIAGYNQAKDELSEVEVRVDIDKLTDFIWSKMPNEEDINVPMRWAEALSSSMGEWLELKKGEK